MIADTIGWIATGTFAASYAFKRQENLRRIQALGASLWFVFGIVTKSAPVMAANAIVVAMALLPIRKGTTDSHRSPD